MIAATWQGMVTMTELATHDERPKRINGAEHSPVLVSGNRLATHFGVSRQHVERFTAEDVIERRADGLFDQNVSRVKYMTHLRAEHRRSPRAAADAEFALAKAELVRIRIAEKKRELIPQEEAFGQMEELVGLFFTRAV